MKFMISLAFFFLIKENFPINAINFDCLGWTELGENVSLGDSGGNSLLTCASF
jgi:hypothetical protein